MSDKKMIIRNCPVCEFSDWEECTGYLAEGYICNDIHTEIVECKDRTDCTMKQIIEKCKRTLSINKGSENEFTLGKMTFAEFILKDIDIQEVE